MAHHTDDAGDTFVDTDFVTTAQRVPGVELRHLGFGEFVFFTPKGAAEVDRMRGEDFPGQKGRSHKLYDDRHGSGAAEWLVAEVEKHDLSQRVAGLRSAVIRLAHIRGDLRPHLLPLLKGAGTTLPGIPAVVTKVRGRMAFVVPVDPGSAPPEIAKGDWFRVLLPVVGEEGKLIPPTSGAKHQDWLFAPYRMNEDYRGEPRQAASSHKAKTEPDARVWYVGGGSWACNVNGEDLRGLRAAFPKSTRRVSRNPNAADSYSIYTTERGSDLIKAWLQEHGRSVGGSPQWDLAPGEMPSW